MRKLGPAIKSLQRCENGTAAIEFAFIGTILILLSIGILEFGRGLHLYNRLSHAADHAARRALTNPNTSDKTLQDEIRAAFAGETPLPDVSVTTPEVANEVAYRVVVITLPFAPVIPSISIPFELRIVRRIPMLS